MGEQTRGSATVRKHHKRRWMGFVLTPLLFVILAAAILYELLFLLVGDVVGYAGMAFLDNPPVLSDEIRSIFVEPPEQSGEDTGVSVALSEIEFPSYDTIYGRIQIDSVGIDCPLVYGDSDKALLNGAGQYIGSYLIGYGGTTLIAAHKNLHFEKLPGVKPGDLVYRYKVVGTAVKSDADATAYDLSREDENIILYTCYYEKTPVGNVKKRFYVYGDYVSGPMLDKDA